MGNILSRYWVTLYVKVTEIGLNLNWNVQC